MSTADEFDQLTSPYRRELLAHCYRILGSVDDAEDQVQETYLRAWRRYEDFDGRASLRTWLRRIATNTCLTALAHRKRQPLPTGLDGAWPQPAPAYLFAADPADPATVVLSRHSMRLALIAALHYLPAHQCMVLILRDVLQWRACEVAELLGTTSTAVNSALQRAHAHIESVAPVHDDVIDHCAQRELLDRFVATVEIADTETLAQLLNIGLL